MSHNIGTFKQVYVLYHDFLAKKEENEKIFVVTSELGRHWTVSQRWISWDPPLLNKKDQSTVEKKIITYDLKLKEGYWKEFHN